MITASAATRCMCALLQQATCRVARALLGSHAMRLIDLLMHASLLAVSACECPDGTVETSAFAARKSYFRQIDQCLASDASCEALCRNVLDLGPDVAITKCVITGTSAEGVELDVTYLEPVECGSGRRPAGLVMPRRRPGIGAWLASIATLEAASVTAFARLARALAHFDAPARLVASARRAIAEELAHAAAVGRLARRYGGRIEAPRIAEHTLPSIDELALDNAVEGQVGETFGALVAVCQARAAADPHVRAVFARIASDEARHAALAHQLAPWLARRSGWRTRNAVARARQDAIARTIAGCDFGLAADERELLGIPAPDRLRAAAIQLFASLG